MKLAEELLLFFSSLFWKQAEHAERAAFILNEFFRYSDMKKTLIRKIKCSNDNREFNIYDATVTKTSLEIASSSVSIFFVIISFCVTFES